MGAFSPGGGGVPPILSNIPILGPILDLIFGSSVQDQINSISNNLRSLGNFLSGALRLIKGFFGALWKFLKRAWNDYIKKAIQWLGDHVRKLRAWLKRTVGPLIKRLQKIKKWYDEHILKQQLRMLQTIQQIRFFLGILRLFHVKWAAKLDQSLADIQNKIEETINIVRGTLNQIINTLAIAFDPTMLITSNVLAASLLGNLGAVKRIFGFGDGRLLSSSEAATLAHDQTFFFASNVDATVRARIASGPTAEDQAMAKEARAAMGEASAAPLPN